MSRLFSINDSLTNRISFYHLVLLLASLPFDMFYSHLILVSYTLHTIIHLQKSSVKPIFNSQMYVLQAVFMVTVLCAIYSTDRPGAGTEIGRRIAILLIPILFSLNPCDIKKYRDRLFLSYSIVCTLTVLYLYADALVTLRHFNLPYSMLFSSNFANHNFSEPINMHATFFSMQIALALVFFLSMLMKEPSRSKRMLYLTGCLILIAGIVQLSSKSVFVALFLIINIAVPWFLLESSKRIRYLLISASLSILIVAGILYSKTFNERYVTELTTDLSPAKKGDILDSRLARWHVILDLIKKKPIIGYGTGTEVGLLHDAFFKNKLYNSFLHNLNAHNEYLSFLIKSGIIGLFVYLANLVFGLQVSIKNRNLLFFSFMLIIATVSCSENILDVDKGVIYYAFFYSLFIFSTEDEIQVKKQQKKHKYSSPGATNTVIGPSLLQS
ncbi:MAG: O-antigen ligase family protein [Mucilaginibacter sp.]